MGRLQYQIPYEDRNDYQEERERQWWVEAVASIQPEPNDIPDLPNNNNTKRSKGGENS